MRCQVIENEKSDIAIVFLHGWCCKPDDFKNQIDYFKKSFSIILPNYTDFILNKINASQSVDFEHCIQAVKECIRSNQYSKLILIGHSMGGVIALRLAIDLKEQVLALFILDTTMSSKLSQSGMDFLTGISNIRGKDLFIKTLKKQFTCLKYDNVDVINQKVDAMSQIWQQAPDVFSNLLYDAILLDKLKLLKSVYVPATYVTSSESKQRADIVKETSKAIKIFYLPAGHFLMFQASDELNQLITKEIKNHFK
ncbi:alpha/beta hydrolase [Thiotrichales bacterium 19S11-10]|nr:alpha/beta hydrolase [Thiotrichales bacterium 19S11-10]